LKAGIETRYGDVYHRPLAWAGQDLAAQWDSPNAKRDTALGNLITDAYRAWTGTDIALEPFAYLGDPLPEGPVVGADVFRSMSYGDLVSVDGRQIASPWRLVTFRATGAVLLHVLDTLLTLGGDYFPQVSGLRLDFDSLATDPYGDAFGTRHKVLPDTVHVNGHKLLADQIYSVTVTAGIYSGLQGICGALGLSVQDVETLSEPAFDASLALVVQRGDLGPATSNRLRDVAAAPGAKH